MDPLLKLNESTKRKLMRNEFETHIQDKESMEFGDSTFSERRSPIPFSLRYLWRWRYVLKPTLSVWFGFMMVCRLCSTSRHSHCAQVSILFELMNCITPLHNSLHSKQLNYCARIQHIKSLIHRIALDHCRTVQIPLNCTCTHTGVEHCGIHANSK